MKLTYLHYIISGVFCPVSKCLGLPEPYCILPNHCVLEVTHACALYFISSHYHYVTKLFLFSKLNEALFLNMYLSQTMVGWKEILS